MESFSWLQLADFPRCALQKHGDKLERALHQDLAELHQLCGPWDLVILTGSLSASADSAGFEKVEQVLRRLWTHLDRLGSRPVLLAVPGKYDWRMPQGTPPEPPWQASEPIEERFWREPESPHLVWIRLAFGAYEAWWNETTLPKPAAIRYGALPGDFSATFGEGIGILGLNSSFRRPVENKHPLLGSSAAIDLEQARRTCGGHIPRWMAAHRQRFLLTHDEKFLDDEARWNWEQINQQGRFAKHLCVRAPTFMPYEPYGDKITAPEDSYLAVRLHLVGAADRHQWRLWLRRRITQNDGSSYFSAPRERKFGIQSDQGSPLLALDPQLSWLSGIDPFLTEVSIQSPETATSTPADQPAADPLTPQAALRALDEMGEVEERLRFIAHILGVTPTGPAAHDVLPIRLPPLALSLSSTDTVITIVSAHGDPLLQIQERLRAAGWTARVPTPLVVFLHRPPRPLPGVTVLGRDDLRSMVEAKEPQRLLASLLWQRSSLDTLSPYRPSGMVTDAAMFFGRHNELLELMALKERRALLIIGPRKVGKSSLLKQASDHLLQQERKAVYVSIRQSITMPSELIEELSDAAQLGLAVAPDPFGDYRRQAAQLGRFIRRYLRGAALLFDEVDLFLREDQRQGGAASEELRALVQEGTCAIAFAGYGTLYRATLSQAEAAYNLGQVLYLGPLMPEDALLLATLPMERMGVTFASDELPRRLIQAVGCYPHLIQEAGARLLSRLRGVRPPVLEAEDVDAVLGRWKPPTAPATLREMLVEHAETNLSGPAQAAIWLLAGEHAVFSREDLDRTLHDAGFPDLSVDQLTEVAQALRISGVCQSDGDTYHLTIPLLSEAVTDLNVKPRVQRIAAEWQSKDDQAKKRFDFWGGNGQSRR